MLKSHPMMPRRAGGFSLIELMVALVVGLIVVGSALAMTVSIIHTNSENVRYTRLTQGLRAVSEIVARELRRARSIDDPIEHIGRPDLDPGPYNIFDTTSPTCAIYAYQGPAKPHRVIRRVAGAGSPARGTVQLATADVATNLTCTATGDILNSAQIDITDFCILKSLPPPDANGIYHCSDAVAANKDCTDLCYLNITGAYVGDQSADNRVQPRSVTTAFRVRSAKLPDAVP